MVADTDAMPATINTNIETSNPAPFRKKANKPPAAAPINKAGDTNPPTKPQLDAISTASILAPSRMTSSRPAICPSSIVEIAFIPMPKLSGTSQPKALNIKTARLPTPQIEKPDCGITETSFKWLAMTLIAKNPNIKPPISKKGSCIIRLMESASSCSRFTVSNNPRPRNAAVIEAIAIGVIARAEKCLKTASCAKIIPAIGA